MNETMTKAEVAHHLVGAISRGDADALSDIFAPEAVIWHSTDQVDMTLPQLQDMLRAIGGIATADVEQTGLHETADGFVLTLKSTYQLRSGGSTSFHAAQVATLGEAGRIVRVDEYLDNAGLDPLVQALASA
jgi:ketosteroid isomerase-like protein